MWHVTQWSWSLRWAQRSRDAHDALDNDAALFGIIQGGVHPDLRGRSLDGLQAIGFDGYAIGGLAVGESESERNVILEYLHPRLPVDRAALSNGGRSARGSG